MNDLGGFEVRRYVGLMDGRSELPDDRVGSDAAGARFFSSPPDEVEISIREVVRIRWAAIGVLAAAVAAGWGLRVALPAGALLAVLALAAGTNFVLPRFEGHRPQRVLGVVLVLDVLFVTALLALTGGPVNPFSISYLIFVMLAAITTSSVWTWWVVGTSSAGFALLFFVSVPLPPELGGHSGAGHGGHQPYAAHLQGMWVAHTLTAIIIAAFVSRLSDSLRRERETRARTSRLLGLATLAAGAAHEIGNPLATIRLSASELKKDLAGAGASEEVLEDLELIDEEVDRAHRVLERMSIGAGELRGEAPVPTDLGALLDETIRGLGPLAERVQLVEVAPDLRVRWPVEATVQALTQLLRNAVQASEAPVRCEARPVDDGIAIDVVDRGAGMSREVLARIGEPFFTTRPGEGQGLGMFIARSLIEHLGGHIEVQSVLGKGTHVRVWLPSGVG